MNDTAITDHPEDKRYAERADVATYVRSDEYVGVAQADAPRHSSRGMANSRRDTVSRGIFAMDVGVEINKAECGQCGFIALRPIIDQSGSDAMGEFTSFREKCVHKSNGPENCPSFQKALEQVPAWKEVRDRARPSTKSN